MRDQNVWSGSPNYFNNNNANEFNENSSGNLLDYGYVGNSFGVRPLFSLISVR